MKDDPDFNVFFVSVVEKNTCVYDIKSPEYSNRHKQDQAWDAIAKEVDASIPECKERWKNVRACFTRHLKTYPSGSGTTNKKPYYLAEFLQFLIPFTKSRKQVGNLSLNNMYEAVPVDLHEGEDLARENALDDELQVQDISAPVPAAPEPSAPPHKKRLKQQTSLADLNKSAMEYFQIQKVNSENNNLPEDADLLFLKSMLPDMKALSPNRKRQFKIESLNLMDHLQKDQPRHSSDSEDNDAQWPYYETR